MGESLIKIMRDIGMTETEIEEVLKEIEAEVAAFYRHFPHGFASAELVAKARKQQEAADERA